MLINQSRSCSSPAGRRGVMASAAGMPAEQRRSSAAAIIGASTRDMAVPFGSSDEEAEHHQPGQSEQFEAGDQQSQHGADLRSVGLEQTDHTEQGRDDGQRQSDEHGA